MMTKLYMLFVLLISFDNKYAKCTPYVGLIVTRSNLVVTWKARP